MLLLKLNEAPNVAHEIEDVSKRSFPLLKFEFEFIFMSFLGRCEIFKTQAFSKLFLHKSVDISMFNNKIINSKGFMEIL